MGAYKYTIGPIWRIKSRPVRKKRRNIGSSFFIAKMDAEGQKYAEKHYRKFRSKIFFKSDVTFFVLTYL